MSMGLYIHYPFCRRVCPFCHFVVRRKPERDKGLAEDELYLKALLCELDLTAKAEAIASDALLQSIYFGGGTPSLFPPQKLKQVMERVRSLFAVEARPEITLEADPGAITSDNLSAFLELGINRLSLGIQTLNDHLLEILDRRYTREEALTLLEMVSDHRVNNVSVDLLYGIPDQTCEQWFKDLEEVSSHPQVTHLSLYNLSSEETRFVRRIERMGAVLPPDEEQVEMLRAAIPFLECRGFRQYEITAWAKPGFEAVHNKGYWLGRPYVGIGLGAHSFQPTGGTNPAKRFWNTSKLKEYKERLARNERPILGFEELSQNEQGLEFLILRLRLREGIERSELDRLVAKPYLNPHKHLFWQQIEKHVNHGFMEWKENHLRLTFSGMMVSNEIFTDFCLTPSSGG